jgi:hypothetical protein
MKEILIAAMLMLAVSLNAQLYTPAKILTTTGQNIQANIKKTTYEGTPQKFYYTDTAESNLKQIIAPDIQSIIFQDGLILENHYIRINVLVRQYIYRSIEDYNFKSTELAQNVLIEKLVSGPISLYLFTDKYDFPHFFLKHTADTGITYLRNKSYVTANMKFHQDQLFKNTINDLLEKNNCYSVSAIELERLSYDTRSMIKLFRQINNCFGATVNTDIVHERKKEKVHFGILGGVATTYLQVPNTQTDRYLSPLLGVYVDIIPTKSLRDYTLGIELSAKPYRMEKFSEDGDVAGTRTLKYAIINMSPVFRKFLVQEGKGIFLAGGFSFGGTLGGKEVYIYKDAAGNQTTKVYRDNKGLWGFIFGTGFDYKQISVHARYSGFPVLNKSNYFSIQSNLRLF